MAGGTDVERHAAAAACDGKGIRVNGQYRKSLRDLNDLPGRERIAHHNLALRPVPRPRGACRGYAVFRRGLRAISRPCKQSPARCARRRVAPQPFARVTRHRRHRGG